ncbi:MAG: D-glycero-alpha-D-manno-heptose-1,7-bisphosphate 7-phosphatase [Alphaproteobacteria bacterium]
MTLIENGDLWRDIRGSRLPEKRPALFLDRDGTVIELVEYLSDPAAVVLVEATLPDIRRANADSHAVVIVTNQSGVGRGYFGWEAFRAVQARLQELLSVAGVSVDATYACPHPPPDAGGPDNSRYRKPAPGMLIRAAEDLHLDLSRSCIIGDSVSDLAAGKAAGLPTGILVPDGYGARDAEAVAALADDDFDVIRR